MKKKHPLLRHSLTSLVSWCLAALVALDGLVVLRPVLQHASQVPHDTWLAAALQVVDDAGLGVLPQVVVAVGLVSTALGLVLRARIAWLLSILLLLAAAVISAIGDFRNYFECAYSLLLIAALVHYWRHFGRSSVTASSLFALLSVTSLMMYSTFGVRYLGNEYTPPIHDLGTAMYFAVVTMSTVGYGDIVPHTPTARLFSGSVIVLGITVFATSAGALIGPLVSGNLRRIVSGGISNVIRKHHYLIVGFTPVAHSVYDGLRARNCTVTVVVPADAEHHYPADADLVLGDATDAAVLERAGAPSARTVLALRGDDAENAFIVLAVRALAPAVKTVVLVNHPHNLERMQLLKPDVLFSPQQVAGELLASTLTDQTIDNSLVAHMLFGGGTPAATHQNPPAPGAPNPAV